ncbi:MAG: cyclic nucleotide-binding domain-containing protein [Bacteroidetes bacterium]|nr:MAG: cyclic nucleotide-binding domain-containing protein [Bacteroidota bacterium]
MSQKEQKLPQKVIMLKHSPLFQQLTDEELIIISKMVKIRQYFPGETLVVQGNPSDSWFLIAEGIVAIKKYYGKDKADLLAYLMTGNTFGEVGIMENRARSANVEAVTDVEVLVIQRSDFLAILHKYPTVTIELVRMLGRYLTEANRRQSRNTGNEKLVLIFDIFNGTGATSLGLMIAKALKDKNKNPTVFTEYPNSAKIATDFNINSKSKLYQHPCGVDITLWQAKSGIKDMYASTMIDNLMTDYDNIVIVVKTDLSEKIGEDTILMLDYVKQMIILIPPFPQVWADVERTMKQLSSRMNTQETIVFKVVSRSEEEMKEVEIKEPYDFEIPYLTDFPTLQQLEGSNWNIPKPLSDLVDTFTDRLERTNQISVFIPTTLDVDKQIDTSFYVQKSLNFLAERFGGATSREANGVWNSNEVGLVGEKVHIVSTYTTNADMNKYLSEVIDYMKELKIELRQEAMALEVNQKLTLI